MRKLFGPLLAATVVILLAGIITSCKKDEPTGPNGGGGNQTVAVTGVSLSKTSLTLAEGGIRDTDSHRDPFQCHEQSRQLEVLRRQRGLSGQ